MSHSWQEFNAEASTSSSKHLKGLPILSRLTRELKSCFLLSELDLDINLNKQKFYLHFVTLTTSLAKSVFKVLTHQSLWNDEKSFFFFGSIYQKWQHQQSCDLSDSKFLSDDLHFYELGKQNGKKKKNPFIYLVNSCRFSELMSGLFPYDLL